ncbi:MAG: hypothetical protein GY722_29310 [bacterium]|nr:hypothetical protein [bacterium]
MDREPLDRGDGTLRSEIQARHQSRVRRNLTWLLIVGPPLVLVVAGFVFWRLFLSPFSTDCGWPGDIEIENINGVNFAEVGVSNLERARCNSSIASVWSRPPRTPIPMSELGPVTAWALDEGWMVRRDNIDESLEDGANSSPHRVRCLARDGDRWERIRLILAVDTRTDDFVYWLKLSKGDPRC